MSIGKVVDAEHAKMKGLHHIKVSVSADKKHYIAEHESMDHPYPTPAPHILKTKGALATHLAQHLKGPGCGDGGMDND